MRVLSYITVDCRDPAHLGHFWRDALGWVVTFENDSGVVLVDPEGGRMPGLHLQAVPEPKVGKARVHLNVWVDDVNAEIDRLIGLGASVLERRKRWDDTTFAVMTDPEGTEFCVARPLPG